MPVGKELGKFEGTFSNVRTVSVTAAEQVVEGSYTAATTGSVAGTVVGTLTFTGTNDQGVFVDMGIAYFDSGDAVPYKAHGVYWKSSAGHWEIRGAAPVAGQMMVAEGQIRMSKKGKFKSKGTLSELQ